MKSMLVFVATFVVALAASTGAKLALTKPPVKAVIDSAHAADSTHRADSTRADTAVVPPGGAPRTAGDSTAKLAGAAAESAKQGAPASAAARPNAPALPPAEQVAVKAPNDTVVEASERRIAKVFSSMDAQQAAKVLEHMADSDVEIILGYVGPRQAASIMAELPPERVATLSKLAMQGKVK